MALRQIRLFDDEVLRKKCKEVKIVDDKIRQILNDMQKPCIILKMAVDWQLHRLEF